MLDLSNVRIAVVHTPCMDGLASAMIIQEALPQVDEVVFCSYGQQQLELKAEPGMLFCDFTPARERVAEFVAAGAIVLDHHVHARDIVEAFGERGRFSNDPGVSGAVLAYREVWLPGFKQALFPQHSTAEFARLVGIRDTWQKDSPDWGRALELHAVLEAFPREVWLEDGAIHVAMKGLVQGLGKSLIERKAATIARIVENGLVKQHTRSHAGDQLWALSCSPSELVSDLAEAARAAGVDVLVNVQLQVEQGRPQFLVNLRSDKEGLDVGALAKRFGGGGHRAAAGFQYKAADVGAADFFRWLIEQATL